MKSIPWVGDIPSASDKAAYDTFSWRLDPEPYPSLPQVEGVAVRAARGFLVEDEVWFDPFPLADHERWWSEVIQAEYDRDYRAEPAEGEHQILYFKVSNTGDFLIPSPRASEATGEAVLRMARLMDFLEVPEDTPTYWLSADGGGSQSLLARDLYNLL